jgi:membrane associated rhomboid family serine protease
VIPLRDNIATRRRPIVVWALIVINVAIFLVSISRPDVSVPQYDGEGTARVSGFDAITLEYGFTPCELASDCDRPAYGETLEAGSGDIADAVEVRVERQPVWLTLLSAMFMHGGWLHLIGNMLFLFVFGNNVEDAMSRLGFLLFYLLSGLAASLTQFAIDTASEVPNIGASGAIAGVLGGYLLLHPRARVLTAVPLLVFIYLAELPAAFVLVTWFALQVLDGSAGLVNPDVSFGIAYFAHIGGFVAGFLLVKPFAWLSSARRRDQAAAAHLA